MYRDDSGRVRLERRLDESRIVGERFLLGEPEVPQGRPAAGAGLPSASCRSVAARKMGGL